MRSLTHGPARVVARSARLALIAVAVLAELGGGERLARAADKITAAACIEANEQARPLRRAGKLREARANLRLCSAESCPLVIRKDCLSAAALADADVPTIAFSAQGPDGSDLTAVTVHLDGQLLADHLDGKALDVDPGPHVFRFETDGQPVVEKQLVIVEGVKNRLERVQIGTPKSLVAAPPTAPPGPRVAQSNGRRSLGLVIGGSGLGLLAAGGVAGLVATLEWNAAKNACGTKFPTSCTNTNSANGDASATLAASTVADVALGLGAVGLVTGAVLVLTAPTPGPAGSGSARWFVVPQVGVGTGGLMFRGSF